MPSFFLLLFVIKFTRFVIAYILNSACICMSKFGTFELFEIFCRKNGVYCKLNVIHLVCIVKFCYVNDYKSN